LLLLQDQGEQHLGLTVFVVLEVAASGLLLLQSLVLGDYYK